MSTPTSAREAGNEAVGPARRRPHGRHWVRSVVVATALFAPFALGSCSSSGDDSSSGEGDTQAEAVVALATCVESTGSLGPGSSLDGRAGEYTLTMVGGPEGDDAGSARGTLSLREQSADLRQFSGSSGSAIPGVVAPLFGSTDVGVEAVGALRVGDLSSADPAAPGVLVIESEINTGPSILLRFGSDANRRDVVRFDGGFTVLEVREIGDDGFSGTWTSGAQGPRAGGYFCAERGAG